MEEQFPNYPELDESLNYQADAEGTPEHLWAHRGNYIQPIECEFFDSLEDEIGKKDREEFVESTTPNHCGQHDLQKMRRKPQIVPEK
jgi:hypothetical protein